MVSFRATGLAVFGSVVALPRTQFQFNNAVEAGTFAGQSCQASVPGELWTLTSEGSLLSTQSGLCATANAIPIVDSTPVTLGQCTGSAAQTWKYLASNQTIYSVAYPEQCINLSGYGTSPGTQAWTFTCNAGDCEGNCAWQPTPLPTSPTTSGSAANGDVFTNVTLVNPLSGLCLQDGSPVPPLPHTCEAGSPSYSLPFCDYTLPLSSRVADLLARMDTGTKIEQFSIPASHFQYHGGLNLKGFLWDITCMRGIAPGALSPNRNVTTYPHAIALAATWDGGLYDRIGAATALEGRIINQMNYRASGGTSWQGVNCDGGPLANTAHDPRWGRISETYGEDPVLSAAMGVHATLALQNRSTDGQWMATAQVTRHYLGYHVASDLPNGGNEFIDLWSFTDQQELPYRSFQLQGQAEGLMCAMSAFSIGDRSDWNSSLAPMIPSCVHPFLWEKLRTQWGWTGYVQSDCCDSLNQAVDAHHCFPDISTAVLNAVEMGLQASYGPDGNIDTALTSMLANGTLDMGLFDARIARTLETRFKLGEFDMGRNPEYPYSGPFDESMLDGTQHRALAREAAAASIVLLNNSAGLLPFPSSLGQGKTVAVIGPFADCSVTKGGYGNWDVDQPLACSYLHSYAGYTSTVSTILTAAREESATAGFSVTYAQGSNIVTPYNGTAGVQQAVEVATAADVVLLVVGLGAYIEHEGLDRTTLQLPAPQAALVQALSSLGSKVVLVIVSAGTVDTQYGAFGAAVQAWYGGEEAGHGLWDVLTGRVNPSAKLPLTVYKEPYLSLIEPLAVFTMVTSQGTGRTYRYLNETASGGAPGSLVHYWFGYGLSYTTFTYSSLSVSLVSPLPSPGADDLTQLATVTFTVTNAQGGKAGAEVAQVYVSVPSVNVSQYTGGAPIPQYSLSGFVKTPVLAPGESNSVSVTLPLRAFLTTGRNGQQTLTGGQYTVYAAGHTPEDVNGAAHSNVLQASVTLPAPVGSM